MHELPPHATIPAASLAPIAKVTNPALITMGGAVLAWAAKTYLKTEIPAEVAISIIGIAAYAVAYLTSIKRRELG